MTDADAKLVQDYLVSQNRPWNVTGLCLNLHKAVGKTAAEQVLEKLSKDDNGPIVELTNGKQKIYYARQTGDVSESDLAAIDQEIAKKKTTLAQLKKETSELAAREATLSSEPTDTDLSIEVEAVGKANHADRQRLAELKEKAGSMSPKKLKNIKAEHAKRVAQWRKRKRMCNDIIDQVLESGNKKQKDLIEEMGLETDADVGVDIKNFQV
eukprot:m.182481 g.182481  ORF g.182481 m.182481 type:complete len:211 (-) comp15538_c0_seq1:48-680(-)